MENGVATRSITPEEDPRVRIHRDAKLTPSGSAAMIERLEEGWSVAQGHVVQIIALLRKRLTGSGDDRQRLVLRLSTISSCFESSSDAPSAHSPLSTRNQRQGRAIQPDDAPGLGL
jgi:hypothetical protein